MRKTFFLLLTAVMALCSCENIFHNDQLDYMWRLDKVEYTYGRDMDGLPCNVEIKSQHWISFARDMVSAENIAVNDTIRLLGTFEEKNDSLLFDFSMWSDRVLMAQRLKRFGMGGIRCGFKIGKLDNSSLVLQGDSTVLYLTRW